MKKETNYFIDIKRFRTVKEKCIENGEKCTDSALASMLGKTMRTFQQYKASVNQRPIPKRDLDFLAGFFGVSADWLCGRSDDPSIHLPFSDFNKAFCMSHGYPADIHAYLVKKNITDVLGRSLNGHSITNDEYRNYLEEIESAIRYITERFIKNLNR